MDEVTDATRQVEDAAARAQVAAQEEADRRARIEAAHELARAANDRVADYETRLEEARARLEDMGSWREETTAERQAQAALVADLEHRLSSAEGRLAQLLNPPPPDDPPVTPAPNPSETIVTVNETPPDDNPSSPPAHRGIRMLRKHGG